MRVNSYLSDMTPNPLRPARPLTTGPSPFDADTRAGDHRTVRRTLFAPPVRIIRGYPAETRVRDDIQAIAALGVMPPHWNADLETVERWGRAVEAIQRET